MRYRSTTPRFLIKDEMTKSQQISQFLEDVKKQLPPSQKHTNSTRSADSPTPRNIVIVNNSRDKDVESHATVTSKYPTYDRQGAKSLDKEYQIIIVNESNGTYSAAKLQPTATYLGETQTITNHVGSRQSLSSRSPKEVRRCSTEGNRLGTMRHPSLPKYPADTRDKAGNSVSKAVRQSIAGRGGTSNIVSFEEFNQRRANISEATQSMIKDVIAKSEKLTSKLGVPQYPKAPKETEIAQNADHQPHEKRANAESVHEKEKKIEASTSHSSENGNKKVPSAHPAEQEPKRVVGGKGDARTVTKVPDKHGDNTSGTPHYFPRRGSMGEMADIMANLVQKFSNHSSI